MAARAFHIATLAFLALPGGALAAQSAWSGAEESQLRLLLAGAEGDHIEGGIEIQLEPGWHTYWRNPGESGVPPVFDFSGSENVENVEVRYPAPMRRDEDGSVSLVYEDEVVFPLSVKPRDAGQPVTLRIAAEFGVCSAICVPTTANAEVIYSTAPDPLSRARLKSFEPRVPKAPEPGRFDIETVARDGDSLVVDVRMPDSSYTDLFADPPAGWFVGQPTFVERNGGVSRYRLRLAGKSESGDAAGNTFRFVAVAGGEAIEKAVEVR